MTSPGETLIHSVPDAEVLTQEAARQSILQRGLQHVGRIASRTALGLSLAISGGVVAGTAVEMAESNPPAAMAADFINDYPDLNAPCYPPSVVNDANGNYLRCDGYDWRVPTRDSSGNITGWPEHTSRGFWARNCTDGVAYWINKYTGVKLSAATLGNAGKWDDNSPSSYAVYGGTTNSIEPGDIAESDTAAGGLGHVGFVTSVIKDGNGKVTSFDTAELNHSGNGEYSTRTYSTRNSGGKFKLYTSDSWDHFIDVNGANKGLNGEVLDGSGTQPAQLNLSFVRLNHSSGNVEVVSYDEAHNFQTLSGYELTGYPAVPPDGNVVPLFKPNGDLSFIRLNYASGNVQVVSYSKASGYKTLTEVSVTGYPDVPGDGSVIPLYQPDGDLSFIRLNHSSGHVEAVTYSKSSGFRQMNDYELTSYPSVTPDGSVVPLYAPNGDLVFVRLNHSSGHAEYVSYSASSGFHTLSRYALTSYPAVPPDGNVVPLIQPDGDVTFVRLNHSSGQVEEVTYGAGSNFQQLADYDLTGYPDVAPDGAVVPMYSS